MIDQLVTPEQVYRWLGSPYKSVNKLCRDGKWEYIRINTKECRFTQEQIQANIDSDGSF
jgi:hypothetical protein